MGWLLIALGVFCGIGLLWLFYTLIWGTPPWINLAVERLTLQMILADPELLTQAGLLDNTLFDFHSGRLTDISASERKKRQKIDREGLILMRRYDPKKLKGQNKATYHLMRWYYEGNLKGHRFDYHWTAGPVFMGPYPVNHVWGVQVDLIQFLATYHQIKGRRSLRRYISRLNQVDKKFIDLQTIINNNAAAGALPPCFVLEKSIAQVEELLAKPVENHPLYMHAKNWFINSNKHSISTIERWMGQVSDAIVNKVNPAYHELLTLLKEQLNQATEDDGVWKLPFGDEYYSFLLEQHTTTNFSPEEIHKIGLDEVQKITAEVNTCLIELGLDPKKPGEQMIALQKDPQYLYTGENVREAIIQDYEAILKEVNQRMAEVFSFGALDKIAVQRLPEYKEPDSPIAYAQPPALDGSRPGTLWLNLRDPGNVYKWGMRTLAYHEGIPGHVYQMSQAQKLRGLPTFRRAYFFNAYVEGWALYAEYLGWELGLEDTLSNLGRLQALLWRAVRLVVDTGIHALRWTRKEAIDYMIETTGLPERDVITEVERYIVMPGQACAYYLGYLEIQMLRRKAQSSLGDAFDIKTFHDVVIKQGGLPLPQLTDAVNNYIDRTAGLKPAG